MSLCLTAASHPHTPLLHLIDSRLRSTNSCAGKVAYASQEGCADRKRACRNRRNPNCPGKGRGHQAAFLSAQQNSGMSMAAAAVASRNQDDLSESQQSALSQTALDPVQKSLMASEIKKLYLGEGSDRCQSQRAISARTLIKHAGNAKHPSCTSLLTSSQ